MKNIALIAIAFVLTLTGCSMCCGPFDYDYPTFGGKHLRGNRSHGRVGSVLSDPLTTLSGPNADSNLTPPPEPLESPSNDEEDDDLLEDDLLDDSLDGDDSLDDDLLRDELDAIENNLERIEPEPLRDSDDLRVPEKDGDDSMASSRWRPRSLR